jgi:hypothetical protein
MRILSYVVVVAVLVLMSACRGSLQQNASSEILVYNNATGALLADANTRGAITLNKNDTRQLRVMRRVVDEAEGTTTTNVTTDADYNTSDPAVVQVGDNETGFAGLITAAGVGTATLNIVVHDPEDPTTDDSAAIDIHVVP